MSPPAISHGGCLSYMCAPAAGGSVWDWRVLESVGTETNIVRNSSAWQACFFHPTHPHHGAIMVHVFSPLPISPSPAVHGTWYCNRSMLQRIVIKIVVWYSKQDLKLIFKDNFYGFVTNFIREPLLPPM